MIIEIELWKKSFWMMVIVGYLVLNWVTIMAFGIVGHRRRQEYDLSDTFAGGALLIMTLGWWFAE